MLFYEIADSEVVLGVELVISDRRNISIKVMASSWIARFPHSEDA
jgi:hypothetical protein